MSKSKEPNAGLKKVVLTLMGFHLADELENGVWEDLVVKFPARYPNENFITVLRADCTKVDDMPLPANRIDDRKKTMADMVKMVPAIKETAVSLSQYIKVTYDAAQYKSELETAGIAVNLPKVARHNWDATQEMFTGMCTYIVKNKEDLEKKGSMPTTFIEETNKQRAEFLKLKLAFSTLNTKSQKETSDINKACLALKNKIQQILGDARATYYKDAEKRKSFQFTTMMRTVNPVKTAGGIRSGLKDAVSSRPIEGAKVHCAYFNKTVMSKKNGRWVLHDLPKGIYTLQISAPNYETVTISKVEVKTGVLTNLKPVLMGSTGEMTAKAAAPAPVSQNKIPAEKISKTALAPTQVLEEMTVVEELLDKVESRKMNGVGQY